MPFGFKCLIISLFLAPKRENQDFPYVIISGEKVISFLFLTKDVGKKEYDIRRLMIDEAYQNCSYGKEVIHQIIQMVKVDFDCETL